MRHFEDFACDFDALAGVPEPPDGWWLDQVGTFIDSRSRYNPRWSGVGSTG